MGAKIPSVFNSKDGKGARAHPGERVSDGEGGLTEAGALNTHQKFASILICRQLNGGSSPDARCHTRHRKALWTKTKAKAPSPLSSRYAVIRSEKRARQREAVMTELSCSPICRGKTFMHLLASFSLFKRKHPIRRSSRWRQIPLSTPKMFSIIHTVISNDKILVIS